MFQRLPKCLLLLRWQPKRILRTAQASRYVDGSHYPEFKKAIGMRQKHYPLVWYLTHFCAEGEVNTGEYSPRRCRGEYSLMFTEPETNSFFSIIFRAEYRGLQNNGLKHKDTDA